MEPRCVPVAGDRALGDAGLSAIGLTVNLFLFNPPSFQPLRFEGIQGERKRGAAAPARSPHLKRRRRFSAGFCPVVESGGTEPTVRRGEWGGGLPGTPGLGGRPSAPAGHGEPLASVPEPVPARGGGAAAAGSGCAGAGLGGFRGSPAARSWGDGEVTPVAPETLGLPGCGATWGRGAGAPPPGPEGCGRRRGGGVSRAGRGPGPGYFFIRFLLGWPFSAEAGVPAGEAPRGEGTPAAGAGTAAPPCPARTPGAGQPPPRDSLFTNRYHGPGEQEIASLPGR